MRAVLQRVREASVAVDGEVEASIGPGFLILLGVGEEDTEEDKQSWTDSWIASKQISGYGHNNSLGYTNSPLFSTDLRSSKRRV